MDVEETITLNPDSYESYRLPVSDDTYILKYDMLVKGDRGIDVLVLDRGQYVKYSDGVETQYYKAYSQLNVGSGILEKPIGDEDYILIVDYTNYATDYWIQPVEVDVIIQVDKLPP